MNNCLLCGELINQQDNFQQLLSFSPLFSSCLCQQCLEQFKLLIPTERCPYCFGQLPCFECKKWQKLSLNHFALFSYNQQAKEWLNRYKIQGDYRLKTSFSTLIYNKLYPEIKHGWMLVPIPLDKIKYKKRGFNQVTALLESAHLPYAMLLHKEVTPIAQGLKNKKERLAMPQLFSFIKTEQQYEKVIVVDDIYTTGRTITRAYECLYPHVKKIKSFSLFR